MGSNKKQNNENRGLLDTQRTETNAMYNPLMNSARGGQNGDFGVGESEGLRNQIRNSYTNNNNGLPAGMTPNANGWFNLPNSGSPARAAGGDFSEARAGYSDFARTGGINRADFGKAQAGYDDFANNGGVDATALRNRATSVIPSFYDAFKRNAERRNIVQGGYSPGFDAQMAEMGRQAGREGFNASRQVEGDIADKVQQGRMFGISGQNDLASRIAGMEQSGRLAGMGGLTNIGQLEQQNSQFNAGLDDASNARNLSGQLTLAGMYQQGGFNNASGLQNLYSSAPGNVGQNYQAYLSGAGANSGNNLSNLGLRNNIQDTNFWDRLPGILGGIGGFMGGMPQVRPRTSDKSPNDKGYLPDPE